MKRWATPEWDRLFDRRAVWMHVFGRLIPLNASGEEFGEERLKELLRSGVGTSPEEMAATLAARMRAWIAGTEQHDDLTFVVAAVK